MSDNIYRVEEPEVEFFSTGSQGLDNALGEGWPSSRLLNIQGDSSSGKTLLAEEAVANHMAKWPTGKIWYVDAEATFIEEYARNIGIDTSKIEFVEGIYTVEDWFRMLEEINNHVDATIEARGKKKKPKKSEVDEEEKEEENKSGLIYVQPFEVPEDFHGLIILDSIDAISDESEMGRDIGEGSYGGDKAKKFSQAFRRLNSRISNKNITVIGISQLRDMVNSPVPGVKIRSGGKAIEFYSSIVVRLAETKTQSKIKRTEKGAERIVGLHVEASCNKNKVGRPYRKAKFKILFEYGIDDMTSNLEWMEEENPAYLKKVSPAGDVSVVNEKGAVNINTYMKRVFALSQEEHKAKRKEIADITREAWNEIEARFTLGVKKY